MTVPWIRRVPAVPDCVTMTRHCARRVSTTSSGPSQDPGTMRPGKLKMVCKAMFSHLRRKLSCLPADAVRLLHDLGLHVLTSTLSEELSPPFHREGS